MKRKIVLALYYMFLQHLPRTDRFCIKLVRRPVGGINLVHT